MTTSADPTPNKPLLPGGVYSSSVLSQDIITSASVLVDSTSAAPVAAFTNPTGGEAEALAVVNKQICHITRDRQTDSGWRAIPLFDGQAAEQVAAAVPFQTTAYGFFIDDGGQLHSTQLGADGKTWSAPVAVADGLMSHPRVAYTGSGAVVIYGVSPKGDLVTAHQKGMTDPFTAMVHPVEGALAGDDFQLCMTDEDAFTILANVNAKAYTIIGDITQTGVVGPAPAPQFTDKLKHVALGYASPAGESLTAIFLLVAEDEGKKCSALHCWSQVGGGEASVQKIANASIILATGHVSMDNSLHVYAIDDRLGLWVLHQSSLQPWRDDGAPNWAPFLPLDTGIGRVVSDMNPAPVPSLFAIDGGDYSLRLHALDPVSRMWQSQKILQHKAEAYEVTRHRVEIRVLDGNARALPNHAVNVTVEKGGSAVEVWAGGRLHLVDEQGVTLTTDITGKLTVAIIATEHGLACPNLVVSSEGLPKATVRPAGGLHEYLSGKGTLNPTNPSDRGGGPLPQFAGDGKTLKTAKVNGVLLAPGASDSNSGPTTAADVTGAIQKGARFALGDTPPGVYGFGGSLVKGRTSFEVFDTAEAFRAHCEAAGLTKVGGFWDELKHFFGDIFEGIKNFVIKIAHFVVDVARSIVQFTLDLAEFTGQLLHLDISGIEKAASFMHGFFNSVDADIDKVVKWLEALFDFGDIWRTKMAIEEGVKKFCPYMVDRALAAQKVFDGWFAKQKVAVNKAFDEIEAQYKGRTFDQLGNWQNPSAPPSREPIHGAGKAAPSDFTDNPHHNWLHDKVTSYSPDTSALTLGNSVDELWKTVERHLADSGHEFMAAITKLREAVWTTITDPSSFATKGIPDLLEMFRDLALAGLDLLDALVDSVAALIGTVMQFIDGLLETELPLGFLNTLWKWMAEAAGYPDDTKLNLYSLSALLAALPCTLIFKLIEGVDQQPFPSGKLPAPLPGPAATRLGVTMPWQSVVTSDVLRMVQVIPAGAADFMASDSPGWLTGVNIVWGGAIWVLRHGYPSQWEELGVAMLLSGGLVGRFIPNAIQAWRSLDKDIANDIVAGLSTVYGFVAFGLGCKYFPPPARPGQQAAVLLLPHPCMYAWLTLSAIRNNPEDAPEAIGGNMFFDALGYIGGGVALLVDTLQHKNNPMVAEA